MPIKHAHPYLRHMKNNQNQNQQQKKKGAGGRTPTPSSATNQSLFEGELPLLESISEIIAQSSYFSVRPLINSQIQSALAKRALKIKSLTNVRISNATYNSLFFDPTAHVPLSETIIEGDSQSLLFTFQRARNLFKKIHQTVAVFFGQAEMPVDDDDSTNKNKQQQQQQRGENKKDDEEDSDDEQKSSPPLIENPENTISLLQVFQQCVFELYQIIVHSRTTICKMPLLFAGTSDTQHMLLEINDWAVQMRETLFHLIEAKLNEMAKIRIKKEEKENHVTADQNEYKTPQQQLEEDVQHQVENENDEIDFELYEASHRSSCLLWSDASWTPPSLRKEIEKAEKWIAQEELQYIVSSFKDLIKKWNCSSSDDNDHHTDIRSKLEQFSLLNCYGSVMENYHRSSDVNKNNKKSSSSVTRRGRGGRTAGTPAHHSQNDDDDDYQRKQEDEETKMMMDEILHDLQLSLQRIQLVTGEKQNSSSENQTGDISTTNNNKSSLLDITATTTAQQNQVRSTSLFSSILPEHVLESRKFLEQLTLTEKMQVTFTVYSLQVFMRKWRIFLKTRKQKQAKIDGIMRKNLALHCLMRFRVWKEKQEEARAKRRATYGTRGQRYGLNADDFNPDDDGQVVVGTVTTSTQTFGKVSNAPRFLLKIVQ